MPKLMAGLQHNMMLVNVPFHSVSKPSSVDILYKHCIIPVYCSFVVAVVALDIFDTFFSTADFPNSTPCNFSLVLTDIQCDISV